jgi:uncharacterized membrane protein YkvA (DUF1232 family)
MPRIFRLWRLAGGDLKLLFSVVRNPNRPRWLVPALIALAVFGLEPFNFAIPIVGAVDDLLILPLLIRALAALAAPSSVQRFNPGSRDERVVSIQSPK